MFMGSALNPTYFKEKVNLYVAMGPVTILASKNTGEPSLETWQEVEYLALKFGAYNLFNAGWLVEEAT